MGNCHAPRPSSPGQVILHINAYRWFRRSSQAVATEEKTRRRSIERLNELVSVSQRGGRCRQACEGRCPAILLRCVTDQIEERMQSRSRSGAETQPAMQEMPGSSFDGCHSVAVRPKGVRCTRVGETRRWCLVTSRGASLLPHACTHACMRTPLRLPDFSRAP